MDAPKLLKWKNASGLATREETLEVKDFLDNFNNILHIYKSAFGEPIGQSVDCHLDNVKWYLNN